MNVHAAPLTEAPEAAIPYAPSRKSAARTDSGDSVEVAGQTIVELLNQAVEAANANTKHALDVAHKLSRQLRVAEERITDFEADLRHYKDRADRADVELHLIGDRTEVLRVRPHFHQQSIACSRREPQIFALATLPGAEISKMCQSPFFGAPLA